MTSPALLGYFCVQARQEYGDKVLASDPNVTATHFLREVGNTPSLRAAAMDQWLFGLADLHVRAPSVRFRVSSITTISLHMVRAAWSPQPMNLHLQVISRFSGYGRTGGWRSRKWHGIFTLDNHRYAPRDCKGEILYCGWAVAQPSAVPGCQYVHMCEAHCGQRKVAQVSCAKCNTAGIPHYLRHVHDGYEHAVQLGPGTVSRCWRLLVMV